MAKPDEFSEILRQYGDVAYRMAMQLTKGNETEARDLVQEGFLKIWRYWTFQKPRSFKGWMYRILHNLYIDSRRRKSRQSEVSLDAAVSDDARPLEERMPEEALKPDELMVQDERRVAVTKALADLETDLRIPVTLCDMEGMSYDEIAKIVSCPIGTVRSRIHRGRLKLRAALGHLESIHENV